MRLSIADIAVLALMVSNLLFLLTGMAGAQEQPNVYETPLAVVVKNDSGGSIAQYIMQTEAYRTRQTPVSFAGRCDSACTLYLNLAPEQICIYEDAYFRFHAPIANSPRAERLAIEAMMKRYPGWVRKWIFSQGGLTRDLLTMDYAYARRFVRECTELVME